MSQRKHDKFILEMKDLKKSLMTFCKPKVSIINNEISIFIQDKEILKTLMFFKIRILDGSFLSLFFALLLLNLKLSNLPIILTSSFFMFTPFDVMLYR